MLKHHKNAYANSCSILFNTANKHKEIQMNLEDTEYNESYQILVCNIHWNIETASRRTVITELPEQIALDVPENVLNQASSLLTIFSLVSSCVKSAHVRYGFHLSERCDCHLI